MTAHPKPAPRVKGKPKGLKPMSDKRRAAIPARQACVEAVIRRDKGCVFSGLASGDHWGPLEAHEPAKRSHGADPTNPDECVCLCRGHHRWVHDNPALSETLGLLTRSTA